MKGMIILLGLLAGMFMGLSNAYAGLCEKPVCRSGQYRDGYCYHNSGFPTYAKSHERAPACGAGWTLNRTRGLCMKTSCCEKPLCPSGMRYSRHGTRSGRTYGVCESRSGLGYRSHTINYCQDGWDLNVARGVCVKRNCGRTIRQPGRPSVPIGNPIIRLPDLIITDWWVSPDARPATRFNEVITGKPYKVCYRVKNIGTAASRPFNVSGGGLGVPRNPSQRQAGLRRGQTRNGCLRYATAPRPRTYNLTITADYPNRIRESRENNNGKTEAIKVLSKASIKGLSRIIRLPYKVGGKGPSSKKMR